MKQMHPVLYLLVLVKYAMLNVNSLFKHIDQLGILLSEKPVDAFAINE